MSLTEAIRVARERRALLRRLTRGFCDDPEHCTRCALDERRLRERVRRYVAPPPDEVVVIRRIEAFGREAPMH